MSTGLLRYVLPVSKPCLLDDDGFLLPEGDPRWRQDPPVPITRLASFGARLALLAPGGAGKTFACRSAAVLEGAVYIDAGVLDRNELRARIDEVSVEGGIAYLDGLDQAAPRDPMLFRWLAEVLTTGAAAAVSWRLACRAMVWEPVLSSAGFTELRLLPLDRTSAETLISDAGYDGPAFVRDLVDARRGGLAACAGPLRSEALYWHDEGRLPEQSKDALVHEVDVLLREDGRRSNMPSDRKLRLAKRLGSFIAFSGAQRLTAAATGNAGTLRADQLPSEPEPSEPNRSVMPDDYREVMDTSLFEAGPGATLSFVHQRYVEYLGASYLVDRDVSVGQIPALLGVGESGVLPPVRIGIAAWLGALAPDLVAPIVRRNALLFASRSAGVELQSDGIRAAVVEGLLESASRDEQDTAWGLDLAGLAHAGLGDLLVRHLSDLRSGHELWWAARLAAAGKCSETVPGLLAAARDAKWPVFARRAAAVAVSGLADDETRLVLLELLDSSDTSDPDNEILATVVDALYPAQMTTQKLTEVLRPHRTHLIGRYRVHTLPGLPNKVPGDDLPMFLTWCANQPGVLTDYVDLSVGLLQRAWQHVERVPVRRALARLIAAMSSRGAWISLEWRHPLPTWTGQRDDLRRALALEVVTSSELGWFAVINLRILTLEDLGWLHSALPTAEATEVPALTRCVQQLESQRSEPPLVDFELPEHEPSPGTDVSRELAQIQSSPLAWPSVLKVIEGPDAFSWTEDLTTRQGWRNLDNDTRSSLFLAGIQYLHEHRPDARLWCVRSSFTSDELPPEWLGVHLMATLAEHAPEALSDLPEDIWKHWSHCIIATPAYGPAEENSPRASLLRAGLTYAREHLLAAARHHLDDLASASRQLTPRLTYEYLAPELAQEIADGILSGHFTDDLASDLLDVLVCTDQTTASAVCRQLIWTTGPLSVQALGHLSKLDPARVIDRLTDETNSDLLISIADQLNIVKLDNDRLVKAAELLLDALPFEKDEPLDAGDSERSEAQRVRMNVLRLLAKAGHVEALTTLRRNQTEPGRKIISRYLPDAESARADLEVPLLTPSTLLELLRHGDSRLVRNNADFVDVVVRQFDDLQHYLRHTNGWQELWQGAKPPTEDDVSDWLQRKLNERLNRDHRVVVDRENQVARPKGRGIGTRVDITPTQCTISGSLARFCIEAKRCDSTEVDTAMREQLIGRYLVPLGLRHGIFIVYWVAPALRPKGWSRSKDPDPAALLAQLQTQANEAKVEGFQITPYVLDLRPVP